MLKRKIKVLIAGTIVLSLVCSSVGSAYAVSLTDNNLVKYNIVEKKNFDDISLINKFFINNSVEKCVLDGSDAADSINIMVNNKVDFEIGVRKVLDKYYSMEKSERGELAAFTSAIDESAKQIVANYAEAERERENKDNLSFETEKVLVSFPNGTPMDVIDTVVGNEAVSYEIVDDGDVNINPNLPDYKLKRLEKIKDWKNDVVVEVTTSLEDTVARAVDKFDGYNIVTNASSNAYYEADGTISDATYSVQTNDPMFNPTDQWNLEYVDIPEAWKRFQSVSSIWEIWVAVIDCGVQTNHPDLQNVILQNYSVDVTKSNYPTLNSLSASARYTGRHGTMVSGIIAAQGNNNSFIAGAASVGNDAGVRNEVVRLMAIKADDGTSVTDDDDDDRHIKNSELSKAIQYAVENGADVINISYSATRENLGNNYSTINTKINMAINADVVVVASAGNDGSTTKRYPAGFDGVIGVGATYKNGRLASYSNRNTSAVDIVAPGGFKGSDGVKMTSLSIGSSTGQGGGTSYAAPHVAATVAMMRSIKYSLTPQQFLTRLQARGTASDQHNFIELDTGESVSLMEEG